VSRFWGFAVKATAVNYDFAVGAYVGFALYAVGDFDLVSVK